MKINELFLMNQGHQITDEEIYFSQGNIPIYTAGNEIKGYGSSSLVTAEQLPCITYQTKAFSGVVTVQYEMFDANNTAVLILREKYKHCINLEYISILLKDILKEYATANSGVSYLNKNIVAEIELELPTDEYGDIDVELQNRYVERYKELMNIKQEAGKDLQIIDELLDAELKLDHYAELKVKEIAVLNKGSNRISEEMIYHNSEKRGIPVYSSATENQGLMGTVTEKCFKAFEKKGNAGELTWATNGYYAGKVFYRDSEYLYTEKCGRLVMREEYKEKIIPKFLCIMLNQVTFKYRTAEATNCKLDIIHMEEIPVKIPIKKDGEIDLKTQREIVEKYETLENLKKALNDTLTEIERLE